MPKEYEAIKKEYLDKGKSKETAERIAAATYNKKIRKHKADSRPVGNKAAQASGAAVESFADAVAALFERKDI